MSNSIRTTWQHGHHNTAEISCQHCRGVIRHEPWCITSNQLVHYAYQIISDPAQLTAGDALILHSLGVRWDIKSPRVDLITR